MDKFIGKAKEIIRKCSKVIKTPFNAIGSSIMTKDEALKILNIKERNASIDTILNQSKEYIESNSPIKGGSFYIQNKVYHAREALFRIYYPGKTYNYINMPKQFDGRIKSSILKEEIGKLNNKH